MLSRGTLISLSMAAITGLGFTECGGSTPTEPIPPPPNPLACESLDEQSCHARTDCRAEYTPELCACPAICQIDPNDPEGCLPVPCDCEPATFAGCVTVGPCEGLDQNSCQNSPGCTWLWADAASGGAPRDALYFPPECACAACDASDPTNCPPCECPPPPPYGICVPADPCQNLPEDQCVNTQGCEPIYGQSRCGGEAPDPNGNGATAPCLPDDPNCFRCDPGPTEYLGCQQQGPICPAVCDIWCPYGNVIDPNGCETCACNPPPTGCYGLDEASCNANPECQATYEGTGCNDRKCEVGPNGEEVCYPCDPIPVYSGCIPREPQGCYGLDEASCNATPECEAQYEGRGCETPYCEVGPNGEEVCYPCDPVLVFVGCAPRGPTGECTWDGDCPNGYCAFSDAAFRAPCEGEDCTMPPPPPQGGICVYPSCDDGQPTLCDAIQPVCAPGEVAAARNGCWACVDARTCGEPPPPPVCGGTDPSEPICALPAPTNCPAGTVPGVSNGCWSCVEPTTCQDVVCHDGSEIICRALPPVCGPGEGLAIINACWACVDPATCQP